MRDAKDGLDVIEGWWCVPLADVVEEVWVVPVGLGDRGGIGGSCDSVLDTYTSAEELVNGCTSCTKGRPSTVDA